MISSVVLANLDFGWLVVVCACIWWWWLVYAHIFKCLILPNTWKWKYFTVKFFTCKIFYIETNGALRSIFRQHLPSLNIVFPSNSNKYELPTTKEKDLHFILTDSGNYDFDIKIERCGLVGFVKAVIDCTCLECTFYFRYKEESKDIFNINFYSIIFLQSFFFLITWTE